MSKGSLVSELKHLGSEARTFAGFVSKSMSLAVEHYDRLDSYVKDYNKKRLELFEQEFADRELAWCTLCSVVIPAGKTVMRLIDDKHKMPGGDIPTYLERSRVRVLCPNCLKVEYDSQLPVRGKASEYIHIYPAEKREDGYWAEKSGEWVKVDSEKTIFPSLENPPRNIGKLEAEWGLPPRLELGIRRQDFVFKQILVEKPFEG